MNRTPHQRLEDLVTQAATDPTPVFEVGIPMRDGVELAADVYLPVESARPAPAIVEATPYDKSNPILFIQAVARAPRLPAGTSYPRHRDQQRLPVVCAQYEPLRADRDAQ